MDYNRKMLNRIDEIKEEVSKTKTNLLAIKETAFNTTNSLSTQLETIKLSLNHAKLMLQAIMEKLNV